MQTSIVHRSFTEFSYSQGCQVHVTGLPVGLKPCNVTRLECDCFFPLDISKKGIIGFN